MGIPTLATGHSSRGERWLAAGGAFFFATALAATAWTFARTFGEIHPRFRWDAALLDAGLLAVFALHHSVFARPAVKARLGSIVPARLQRTFYVYLASVLLVLVCRWWQPVGGVLFRAAWPLAALLHAMQIAGVVLVVWAARTIDPLELAGLRSAPANGTPTRSGPYGRIRHPIYLGWILLVCSAPLMTGDRLLFAALTTTYIVVAIPWEERDLRAAFGESYERYVQRVRWRLVPGVF